MTFVYVVLICFLLFGVLLFIPDQCPYCHRSVSVGAGVLFISLRGDPSTKHRAWRNMLESLNLSSRTIICREQGNGDEKRTVELVTHYSDVRLVDSFHAAVLSNACHVTYDPHHKRRHVRFSDRLVACMDTLIHEDWKRLHTCIRHRGRSPSHDHAGV